MCFCSISRHARSFGVPIPKHVAAITYYQLISTAATTSKTLTDEVNHINRSYSTVFPGSWFSCTCALTHETCQNIWIKSKQCLANNLPWILIYKECPSSFVIVQLLDLDMSSVLWCVISVSVMGSMLDLQGFLGKCFVSRGIHLCARFQWLFAGTWHCSEMVILIQLPVVFMLWLISEVDDV